MVRLGQPQKCCQRIAVITITHNDITGVDAFEYFEVVLSIILTSPLPVNLVNPLLLLLHILLLRLLVVDEQGVRAVRERWVFPGLPLSNNALPIKVL